MRKNVLVLVFLFVSIWMDAQTASIKELDVKIPTYGFSDPDPVPILSTQPELYPYHKFSTYTNTAQEKNWKVLILENDYLKVEILPEVGGKIWGITEKKTGYDIIYKNETLKFRNIATRGPWTSGGIEFNFGFFGHTPYASTPVSYHTYTTPVGDAVCILGAMDLPSRSDWRVKITLPVGKAWMKIECAWINTNHYTHPYYYWTNAAVRASDHLVFNYPGNAEIGHGGDAHPFPVDEAGRDLSAYKNNDFGSNKSYHIIGDNKPFKAVYWKDRNVGVGSFADKFNILGKKLWIWSMAPAGAIWEELLTDHNGQYIEIQSGRLYNQASPESGIYTPYTQYEFRPYQSDYWCEYWYPVIATGGVSEASKEGILYVETKGVTGTQVKLMALEPLTSKIIAIDKRGEICEKGISLLPTESVVFDIPFQASDSFKVFVQGTDLYYHSENPYAQTNRPMVKEEVFTKDAFAKDLIVAEENFKYRRFGIAEKHYKEYLKRTPYSIQALSRMAEICMRTNRMNEASEYLTQALKLDTYDGYANFLFGIVSSKKKDYNTAEEAFAIASRNNAWKVPSYIETAQIFLINQRYHRAIDVCRKALLYDARNINTLKLLALSYKVSMQVELYRQTLDDIKNIDCLDSFVAIEEWMSSNEFSANEKPEMIRHNEFSDQLLLEQAIYYHTLGFNEEAMALFKMESDNPVSLYWLAYLDGNNASKYLLQAQELDIRSVFPYREETYEVLQHASILSSSWKIRYYMALLQWKWENMQEASSLFTLCGQPESGVFYLIRGVFNETMTIKQEAVNDFRHYLALNKSDWRAYYYLIKSLKGKENLQEAKNTVRTGMSRCKNQFILQYEYANLLIVSGNYKKALGILKEIVVLPAEHTGSAYPLYYAANILQGLEEIKKDRLTQAIEYIEASKKWPVNLGGGFGYSTDFTFQDLLINHCFGKLHGSDIENFISGLEKSVNNKVMQDWITCYREKDIYGMNSCIELLENQSVKDYIIPNDLIYLKSIQLILNQKK